jgi:ATP-dependent Clp endopeptidase proteolytic subunit ClpP
MTGDIFIFGPIGTARGEVSFENVQTQLAENKAAKDLTVHIISPGGDVFEGEAIYNALKNSGKKITTHIEGTCASIATLIAGAGDKVIMNKTGRFMIHNPQVTGLQGPADSRQLRHVATQLDKIKGLLIGVWENKTSLGKEKLWELYDNETWLTAEEAQQFGFIDESVDAIKAVASVDLKQLNKMKEKSILNGLITGLKNLIVKVTNQYEETLEDGTPVTVMSEDGDFTGKQIVFADGSPVPAGEHKLASGKTLVVGEDSTITKVKEPEPVDNTQIEDEMKQNEEIENLKAQLAEAKAQAEAIKVASSTEVTETKAQIQNLINKFSELEKKSGETVGTLQPVHRGPVFKNVNNPAAEYDPMGEEALKVLRSRNLIDY